MITLSLVNNIASMNTQRHLETTQRNLTKSIERLSSGLRINGGGDDAAGLAISEKLRSQIMSLAQAERNTNNGISLLQTADGAMNEVAGLLGRMRELGVQAADGALTAADRLALHSEFTTLRTEIDRLAATTEFNGIVLLNNTTATVTLQVGMNNSANDRITVTNQNMLTTQLGNGTFVSGQTISTVTGAQNSLAVLDDAINDVSTARGATGAIQNRLVTTIANLSSMRENLSAAESRIRDVDVAEETAALTRHNLLMQVGVSVLAQANSLPALVASLLT